MKLSLFAKIFASFWLTTIAVAMAVAWSTYQLVVVSRPATPRGLLDGRDSALAEAANAVFETRGLEGLGAWIGRLNQPGRGPVVLLLDARGRVLAGPADVPALSPHLLPGPGQAPSAAAPMSAPGSVLRRAGALDLTTVKLDTGDGDPLWIARLHRPPGRPPMPGTGRPPGPGGPHDHNGPNGPAFGIVRVVVALLVSGLICWLLARHLTRPIRELQAASGRLAAGDFSLGLSARTLARRDELAALARDFTSMAEQLRQLIDAQRQLLRNVSHELRSPLARLQVAAALARRRGGGSVDSEIDRIDLETARLDELIGQLLALMRLESAASLPQSTVNLSDLCTAITRDAQFEAEARDVQVQAEIAANLMLKGNADVLRSVFDNLLRNALRHTRPGTAVRLDASRDAATGEIVISVSDEGHGVPASMLERIFEAFVRVDDARSTEAGGTGLGLAIARQGVRAHGGSIAARNRVSGGLVVEVRLPGPAV